MVFEQADIAGEMAEWFDGNVGQIAFRLELVKNEDGSENLLWHGVVDGEQRTLDVEPYSSLWQRFVTGFLSLLPIESQL